MKAHFFPDNQKVSSAQLAKAVRIGAEYRQICADRMDFIARHGIDPAFALPSANWAADADNEMIRIFDRVSAPTPGDLSHFRGLTSMFSGYSLYDRSIAEGLSISRQRFDAAGDARILDRLHEPDPTVVDDWRRLSAGVPRPYRFSPPAMLGEIGHVVDDVIVNDDNCNYQERINLLWRSGILGYLRDRLDAAGEIRICEIGGGYGALCHWFKQVFPAASYTIIDLPESLLFSNLYMALTRPDLRLSVGLDRAHCGVRFLPNHMCGQLDEPFDLVINTLSMSEMSVPQVEGYIDLMITRWLRNGGLFFEQNQDNRHLGLQFAQEICARRFPHRRPLYGAETIAYRNGYPNIWSVHPIELANTIAVSDDDAPAVMLAPPRLVESIGDCNIVAFSERFYALSRSLGALDLGVATTAQLAELPSWDTLDAARAGVIDLNRAAAQQATIPPRLVKAMDDHNVVAYQGRFFTVPHRLGEIDLAQAVAQEMNEIESWDTLEAACAGHDPGPAAHAPPPPRGWVRRVLSKLGRSVNA